MEKPQPLWRNHARPLYWWIEVWRHSKGLWLLGHREFAWRFLTWPNDQLLIYVAHTMLTEDDNPLGYLLLRCLRSYLVVDMFAALVVLTEDTIAAGRAELRVFSGLIQVCGLLTISQNSADAYVDSNILKNLLTTRTSVTRTGTSSSCTYQHTCLMISRLKAPPVTITRSLTRSFTDPWKMRTRIVPISKMLHPRYGYLCLRT